MDFPSNWPVFPTKDQLADFLEFYARTLDLQVWLTTEYESARYDDSLARWTIETVTTDGRVRRVLHPRHLIYAGSGHVGTHPNLPKWPGRDEFQGRLYHATDHTAAALTLEGGGRKVAVVGSNTTAHDICLDFVEAGADVTMIQRGPSFIMSTDSAAKIALPPPDEGLSSADFVFNMWSFPTHLACGMMTSLTQYMLAQDAKLVAALDRTEFAVDKGETGDNFLSRALRTRGGFYVNDGASDAVADGRIRVLRSPEGIESLTPHGLVLADGRTVDADVIVLATSWKLFEEVIGEVMGEDVSRRTSGRWGLDEEGEQSSVRLRDNTALLRWVRNC